MLVVGIVAGPGCNRGPSGPPQRPPATVVVGTPLRTPIVEWDEYVGRLEAVDLVEVRARVSGYLESTRFSEGQIVKAGDLLAVIDQRPFVAEVNRNEANLAEAQAKLGQATAAITQATAEQKAYAIRESLAQTLMRRTQQLREGNAVSQEDLDVRAAEYAEAQSNLASAQARVASAEAANVSARAAVDTARANLALAKLNLEYTKIVAPITGRISHRYVTEGNLISGGSTQSTLITTIVSLDPIHCVFDADERAFLKYERLAREGKRTSSRDERNPVFVGLADEGNSYPHHGHMDFVENRLDSETGTIRGRALLPNSDLALTPGLFARVRIPGSGRYDAVLVPDSAVGTDQSEKFVLVVDGQDTVQRQVVQLGPISNGLRVIREGLQGNERVVLSGVQRARPGAKVATKEEQVVAHDDGLPNDYQLVPEEQWLIPRRKPAANVWIPPDKGIETTGATGPIPSIGDRGALQ